MKNLVTLFVSHVSHRPSKEALFETGNESSLTRAQHNSTEVNGNDILNASVGKTRQTSVFPPVFMNTPVLGVGG